MMAKNAPVVSAEELAKLCAETAEKRKAENVNVLKIGDVSLIADYFVICAGGARPHLKALRDWITRQAREKLRARPLSVDGDAESEWIIIDFGNVIVHILSAQARERYQLEELWGDAPRLRDFLMEKSAAAEPKTAPPGA